MTATACWTRTGPEDLNGDGIISQMRVRDENGPLKTSPKDPRLMVHAGASTRRASGGSSGPRASTTTRTAGSTKTRRGARARVTNRNYPALLGAGSGSSAGTARRRLSAVGAGGQGADRLPRGPSEHRQRAGVPHPQRRDPAALLQPGRRRDPAAGHARTSPRSARSGTELTGYPVLSVYNDFTTDKSNPRHGVFVDWAYDFFGAFAFTTEIWKAPGETGKSAFDTFDENLAMAVERPGARRQGLRQLDHVHAPAVRRGRDRRLEQQLLQPEPAAEVRRGRVEEELPVRDQARRAAAVAADRRCQDRLARRPALPDHGPDRGTTVTCRPTSPRRRSSIASPGRCWCGWRSKARNCSRARNERTSATSRETGRLRPDSSAHRPGRGRAINGPWTGLSG